MEQDDEPPSGTVEIDETLVGVERGNNPKYRNVMSPFANKTPVADRRQRPQDNLARPRRASRSGRIHRLLG